MSWPVPLPARTFNKSHDRFAALEDTFRGGIAGMNYCQQKRQRR
jgi:hypothetical protein